MNNRTVKIVAAILTVGALLSTAVQAKGPLNCRAEWQICINGYAGSWTGDDSIHEVGLLQIGNHHIFLAGRRSLVIHHDGSVWLQTAQAPIHIGQMIHILQKDGIGELKLDPKVSVTLSSKNGPDKEFCNPIDGPLGHTWFQRDKVRTKVDQLIITEDRIDGKELLAKIISAPEPIYPAYESRVSRKRCQ